jgi:hypothetical protein
MTHPPEHDGQSLTANLTTRWVRASDVVWRASLDRVIVSPPGSQRVLTLTGTATELWFALAEPTTLNALSAAMTEIYSSTSDNITADLTTSLHELAERGAIKALA